MKFDVFGRDLEVIRKDNKWLAYYLGNEGKKRIAGDIFIPAETKESELIEYLADLCHEWACPGHEKVLKLN